MCPYCTKPFIYIHIYIIITVCWLYYIIHSLTIIYNYYCPPKILNRPLCPLLQKLLDETLHHIGEGLVSSTHVCVCVCVISQPTILARDWYRVHMCVCVCVCAISQPTILARDWYRVQMCVCVCVCHITTHHIGKGLPGHGLSCVLVEELVDVGVSQPVSDLQVS